MAFKWFFGKKKDKDAVETPEEKPLDTTSETLSNESEDVTEVADLSPVDTGSIEDASVASEPTPDGEIPSGDLAMPDAPADDTVEDTVEEVSFESVTDDLPADEVVEPAIEKAVEPVAETAADEAPADTADIPAESAEDISPEIPVEGSDAETVELPAEESVDAEAAEQSHEDAAIEETPVEDSAIAAEGDLPEDFLADDGIDVVPMAQPVEDFVQDAPAAEAPTEETNAGEGESSFVMDDDYLRAFMEEGAMDDYIYSGTFEERQEALDRIADNAETLAEEGTELLEKMEKEKEQTKEEPRYNEKGELLDENGKVVLKRTLENKLIIADTRERRYYNKLKNELLSYEGIKSEMQVATEVFRHGKQVVARITLAGFTRIYFALNPDEFDVDRYKQADQSQVDFEDARMMLRVRDDDEYAVSVELIAIMMGAFNINRLEAHIEEDYLPAFPRREDAVLEKKGKLLAFEEKDEKNLLKEKRAEERRAAGLADEPEEEVPAEEEVKEEPLVILPLTLDNKLHQTTNTIKLLYSKLKNEILSYKSVKSEMNVKNENFKAAKKIVARMTVVADSVRLYLALDPKEFSTRKYKHKDASDQQGYEGTLLMMKISGEKEKQLAVQLIAELMKKLSLERNKRYAYVPFAEKYPYIKNGVFKGDEDKPRVKHEGEEYADIYGELTEHLRSQMGSTDAWGVPKGYTAEDGLTARDLLEMQRSKAKTINAGVALATPIVYFYDAAINEEGKVQYLNVQQVLNDKFLGKMIPQEYFAMAEGSSRIEELNFIALESIVKDCNENPDIRFVTKISCRLLLKQETLTKLVDKMHTEHGNLILAFDCAMLEAVGFVGISAINTLKSQGALIMIDNAESASMRVLTEYDFDYLRLDARYYNGDSTKRLAHLDMITGYADVQNIITTSINCEHKEDARILLDHGVKVIQGDAVARPMRLINLALTNLKPIPKVKRNGEN